MPDDRSDHSVTEHNRRQFVKLCSALAGGLVATAAVPVVAVVLEPLTKRAVDSGDAFIEVGPLGAFRPNTPTLVELRAHKRDAWSNLGLVVVGRAFVIHTPADDKIEVFSSVCPHLVCSVAFEADKERFFCPCHQGVFDRKGQVTAGPPPRGLDPLLFEVRDTTLWIRFQRFKPGQAERVAV